MIYEQIKRRPVNLRRVNKLGPRPRVEYGMSGLKIQLSYGICRENVVHRQILCAYVDIRQLYSNDPSMNNIGSNRDMVRARDKDRRSEPNTVLRAYLIPRAAYNYLNYCKVSYHIFIVK